MGHCFNFRPRHLFYIPAPAQLENVIQIWRFRSGFLLINELRSSDEDSAGQRSSLERNSSCERVGECFGWRATQSGPACSLVTWKPATLDLAWGEFPSHPSPSTGPWPTTATVGGKWGPAMWWTRLTGGRAVRGVMAPLRTTTKYQLMIHLLTFPLSLRLLDQEGAGHSRW